MSRRRRWDRHWGIINPVIKRLGPDGDGDDGGGGTRGDDGGAKLSPPKPKLEMA